MNKIFRVIWSKVKNCYVVDRFIFVLKCTRKLVTRNSLTYEFFMDLYFFTSRQFVIRCLPFWKKLSFILVFIVTINIIMIK